jgi:hypothetical protein
MTRLGIVVCGIAVAACGNKQQAANRAELEQVRTAATAVKRCLTSGAGGDFALAVARTIDKAGYLALDCTKPATVLLDADAALAKKLGESSKLAVPQRTDLVKLADVCAYVATVDGEVAHLAKKVGVPADPVTVCDPKPFTTHYLEAPEGLLEQDHFPELSVRDGVLIAYARDNDETNMYPEKTSILARTADGVTWDARKMPKGLRKSDWSRFGLVALLWPKKPSKFSQLQLDDGKHGFAPGAIVTADGVSSIWLSDASRVSVIGFENEKDHKRTVRRSHDGGKTIGKPIVMFDDKTSDATSWVRDDGTVVIAGGSSSGVAHFEVSRLAPDTDKPVTTGSTSWSETGDAYNAIKLCTSKDVYWALARTRHVMVSTDAGVTWKEAADLGVAIDSPRLTCGVNQLVIWSSVESTKRELRLCTRETCGKPIAVPVVHDTAVGIRVDPKPELWIGNQTAALDFLMTVNRIEPTGLVPDHDLFVVTGVEHAGEREPTLHVVHDANGFVEMRRALGLFGY